MDYETLFVRLSKESKRWTIPDVGVWLDFIGLSTLQETFSLNSIDGSCLGLIEEQELEVDLGITNKIVRKKLANWLKTGLREFDNYVNSQKMIEEPPFRNDLMLQENLELTNERPTNLIDQVCDLTSNYFIPQSSQQFQQPYTEEGTAILQQEKPQQSQDYLQRLESLLQQTTNELIIQPMEGPQTNFYCIKETGGKIGRHSSNQILILEESISRFHAEIIFNNGQFFIKDIGSTTGTFIKVESKIPLQVGLLIELGSNQFEVESISCHSGAAEVNLVIIEGPNQLNRHKVVLCPSKSSINVGRKPTADINFPDDHHLSNLHAKLCLINGKVYLEDMGSTNGSWLRLSKENSSSPPFPLNQDTIFKIGTTTTYTCKKHQQQQLQDRPSENACIICCESDRDALYMPCKHNTACLKCSKGLKDCPICRTKIEDIIRIYKN